MRAPFFLVLGVAIVSVAAIACSGSSSSGGPGDAGATGCSGEPPPGRCLTGCNGGSTGETCVNGVWTCPPEPEIECPVDAGSGGIDGAASDAGSAGDAAIDCVTVTCNANAEYCDIRGGGAQLPDAASNMSYSCLALPAMPCDAGTGCACIPNKCSCTDDGGAITNECLYP